MIYFIVKKGIIDSKINNQENKEICKRNKIIAKIPPYLRKAVNNKRVQLKEKVTYIHKLVYKAYQQIKGKVL